MISAKQKFSLEFVIEAGLQDLIATCGADVVMDLDTTKIEIFYGQFIIHFLRGEVEQMNEKIEKLASIFGSNPDLEVLAIACLMRQQIRARFHDLQTLEKARDLAAKNQQWRGELLILIATASTLFDDYEVASKMYKESADAFQQQGCIRKSLRARMNVLVCESHLFPNRNFFARYHDLYKQAMKKPHRELIVATTCLLNISREYQRTGAPLAAMKYCNHALTLFENQMGELNYFLTLAHRAHLLCEMGRVEEARIDYETAKMGRFKEVDAALKVVESLLRGESYSDSENTNLLPTWQERTVMGEKSIRLSSLEEKLIQCLASGPKERVDILENIYGPRLDYEIKINRFKSLIGTFRKKFPNLVMFENGHYRLADEILIPAHLNPKNATPKGAQ